MKLLKILLVFSLFLGPLQARNTNEKRTEVISIIDEELNEIMKLNKQTGNRKPNLLLRMAELFLEKARHIKEQENLRYLSLDRLTRANSSKASYFKKSKQYFVRAQKTCVYILKRFKKFKHRGDIYYILAYNAKEFQQGNKAKDFFKRAIKYSSKSSNSGQKSKLALAEIYYNQKAYKKSIPLYKEAFRKKKNRWYTKNAFNLAWSYYRVKQKTKAIALMNKIYDLSKNSYYVDMRKLVERDLALFYTESGRTKDAIKFYRKIGKNIAPNLIKVAKYLITQGKRTSAESALTEAKRYTTTPKERVEANIALLGVYERYGKTSKHLKICNELYEDYRGGYLDEESLGQLKYHVQRMSALLQKKVASKRYKKQRRTKKKMAKFAIAYFNILAGIDGKNTHRAVFHAAETNYASGKFNEAVGGYDKAYTLSRQKGDKKIARLALDGMIAALGKKGITKETKDKYLTKVYLLYIQKSPRSKRSSRIYQRLFSSYVIQKDFVSAEKVLLRFKKNFPRSISIQEAMLAKIMDHYRSTSNKASFNNWVKRINSGEFKVSRKYAKKVKLHLMTMQFEGVEKHSSRGDKTNALKGYVHIYRGVDSGKDAKRNAAYNVAILFYELGNAKFSYLWSMKALTLMSGKDVKKFDATFLAISSDLFNRLEFEKSINVNRKVLDKLCKEKNKNKKLFFRNANVVLLSEGKLNESQKLIRRAARCSMDKAEIQRARVDLMNAVIEKKQWGQLAPLIDALSKDKAFRPTLIYPLSILRKAFVNSGRERDAASLKSRILEYYAAAKRKGHNIPLSSLDVVASYKLVSLARLVNKLKAIKLRFPEKTYNSRLKAKFSLLDKVTSKSLSILEIGSGEGIVTSYKYLVSSYQSLVDEIINFAPKGKSPEYVKSFQATMRKIVLPLGQKAKDFRGEAKKQILKSSILSVNNSFFLNGNILKINLEYRPPLRGVLMDRGGGQ